MTRNPYKWVISPYFNMSTSTSLCFPLGTVLYSTTDMLALPNVGRSLSFNPAGHVTWLVEIMRRKSVAMNAPCDRTSMFRHWPSETSMSGSVTEICGITRLYQVIQRPTKASSVSTVDESLNPSMSTGPFLPCTSPINCQINDQLFKVKIDPHPFSQRAILDQFDASVALEDSLGSLRHIS